MFGIVYVACALSLALVSITAKSIMSRKREISRFERSMQKYGE